jgi:hypothetical protein
MVVEEGPQVKERRQVALPLEGGTIDLLGIVRLMKRKGAEYAILLKSFY